MGFMIVPMERAHGVTLIVFLQLLHVFTSGVSHKTFLSLQFAVPPFSPDPTSLIDITGRPLP